MRRPRHWAANHVVDTQLGTAVILKALMQLDSSVDLSGSAAGGSPEHPGSREPDDELWHLPPPFGSATKYLIDHGKLLLGTSEADAHNTSLMAVEGRIKLPPRSFVCVFFMNSTKARAGPAAFSVVEKCPTGIAGLDEITFGGLPKGRPTLLCGSAGCGKTVFAMTFLYKGAVDYDEPGVFIAFEERPEELIKNVGSLEYDLKKLIGQKKLAIDFVHIDPNQIDEVGDYDLEGLFLRLGFAIESVRAKRVVIDTIEVFLAASRTS